MTPENMQKYNENYIVEYLKKYFDQYPQMFHKESNLRDRFLDVLKGARIKLRKYPEVIKAMYHDIPD